MFKLSVALNLIACIYLFLVANQTALTIYIISLVLYFLIASNKLFKENVSRETKEENQNDSW